MESRCALIALLCSLTSTLFGYQQGKLYQHACGNERFARFATCNITLYQQRHQKCNNLRQLMALRISPIQEAIEESSVTCIEDEMLDDVQIDYLIEALKVVQANGETQRRRKRMVRTFADFPLSKWTLPIPYMVDGNLEPAQRAIIEDALRMWSESSCVKFKRLEVDQPMHDQHLLFTASQSSGCYSYIGRKHTGGIPQPIYLSPSCFSTVGYVAHEIGHSLGLFHEHQRLDRDQYIQIDIDNIKERADSNFGIIPARYSQDLGVAYDYASSMHYRATAFSKNGKPTLITKDQLYQRTIGQRIELSFTDTKIVNLAYCAGTCDSKPELTRACQNSGYRDPENCGHCRCPDGWEGDFCDIPQRGNGGCGGVLQAGRDWRDVESPGYSGGAYDDFISCSWLIRAPLGRKIRLKFVDNFGVYCFADRCRHWIEVRYKTDLGQTGPRFCCYKRPSVELNSTTSEMLVLFRSKFPIARRMRRGFRFVYSTDEHPGSCRTNPCKHGRCIEFDDPGEYACHCFPGWYERNCNSRVPRQRDVVLMMDATWRSGYQWGASLPLLRNFVKNSDFGIWKTRIGLLVFSEYPLVLARLNDHRTINEFMGALEKIRRGRSTINFFSAFWLLRHHVFQGRNGDRKNVSNIAILFTENSFRNSTHSLALIEEEANMIRQLGVRIIIVGTGSLVEREIAIRLCGFSYQFLAVKDHVEVISNDILIKLLAIINRATEDNIIWLESKTASTTTVASPLSPHTSISNPTSLPSQIISMSPTFVTSTTQKSFRFTPKKASYSTQRNSINDHTGSEFPSPFSTVVPKQRIDNVTRKVTLLGCRWENSECTKSCGGCGKRTYSRLCDYSDGRVDSIMQITLSCNTQLCPSTQNCDNPVYIGRFYSRTCQVSRACCVGYKIYNNLCIEDG